MQNNERSRPDSEQPGGGKPQEASADDSAENAAQAAADAAAATTDESADPRDARIAELEAELAAAKDQQLRALADAENTRRRSQREREEAAKYGAVALARDLLNVADNLRRALDAVPEGAGDADPSIKSLVDGIAMVEQELASVFEKHHVRPVPGVGEPFDHNVHQAVVELPAADIPAGHVAQVLQAGYVLHDRLLRASMVAVAKAP